MGMERLTMMQIREILRQKWEMKRTHREVAAALRVSIGAVSQTTSRAARLGLSWASVQQIADGELEERLYGRPVPLRSARPAPNLPQMHQELRKTGVTLELLHLEYLQQHPDGFRYSKFCGLYRTWVMRQKPTMRQVHVAGEKVFVDYSGKRPHIVNSQTGECIPVELFVGVLGASNFTFAECTLTQRGPDWIGSHVRMFRYFGGVPRAAVPDNLKSGVTRPNRYEPEVQRTYEEMAIHYSTSVLPARPKHPRDKAKVEVGVQVVQRWILARLRNQVFFSLVDLNERIGELLEDLNDRVMRIYGKSRRALFEALDKPALSSLPSQPFVFGEWKTVTVNIDYHVEVDHHFYSAPFTLVHHKLESRLTATTLELFEGGERVASHVRSHRRGVHSTTPEHMPKGHREHAEWTPERIRSWASSMGPQTTLMVDAIIQGRAHPEQGFRSCLGILRLGKQYGHARLELACARALSVGAKSYRHVENMLKNRLESTPLADASVTPQPGLFHENIRGGGDYN